MKVQSAIFATLKNFDFDVRFNITKYTLYYIPKRGDSKIVNGKGYIFKDNVKAIIKNLRPGDKMYFDEISARGPDGKGRKLAPIIFNIK